MLKPVSSWGWLFRILQNSLNPISWVTDKSNESFSFVEGNLSAILIQWQAPPARDTGRSRRDLSSITCIGDLLCQKYWNCLDFPTTFLSHHSDFSGFYLVLHLLAFPSGSRTWQLEYSVIHGMWSIEDVELWRCWLSIALFEHWLTHVSSHNSLLWISFGSCISKCLVAGYGLVLFGWSIRFSRSTCWYITVALESSVVEEIFMNLGHSEVLCGSGLGVTVNCLATILGGTPPPKKNSGNHTDPFITIYIDYIYKKNIYIYNILYISLSGWTQWIPTHNRWCCCHCSITQLPGHPSSHYSWALSRHKGLTAGWRNGCE